MDGLDRHIRSIHIIRNISILNLTFHLPFLALTLTPPTLLLLLRLLLLLLIMMLIWPLVACLRQIAWLMCIGMLILEISLEEFLNRPTMWESV